MGFGSSISSALVGTAEMAPAVGAQGPIAPATSGLFGSAGELSPAFFQTTSALSTGVGAFATVQAGNARAAQFEATASSLEVQQEVVRLNAIEKGNLLKQQLLADIGAANASFAGRGVDVGSGTPRRVIEQSIGEVKRDVLKIEAGAEIEGLGLQSAAARTRASGASAQVVANLNAAKSLVGYGLKQVL